MPVTEVSDNLFYNSHSLGLRIIIQIFRDEVGIVLSDIV